MTKSNASQRSHRGAADPPPAYLEVDHPVATLVLNRPEKLNAISPGTLAAIEECLGRAESDSEVRALVIRGAGRGFCSGADLGAVGDRVDDVGLRVAYQEAWRRVAARLESSRLPSLAAVHGICYAGGFEMMLACDFVVATEDARLGDRHAVYGLMPGGGGSQRLSRLIGARRAMWLMMSGEDIDPRDALVTGLVNEVCPPGEVLERARAMALRLAERSPVANANVKRAVRMGAGRPLDEAIDIERDVVADHLRSEDVRIGLEAFARRSKPEFTGR